MRVKLRNRIHHNLLLVLAQLRIHWQRQNLIRGAFALGEVAAFVAHGLERLLQMQRHRIVDLAADLSLRKKCAQLIPPWGADHVLMEDMYAARIGVGKYDAVYRRLGLDTEFPARR